MDTTKSLYVIGNGFDLHHGIKSSFGDFARYTKREHNDVAEAVEHYLPAVGENWWNLEAALAELDCDAVVDECSCFLVPYGAEDFSASAYGDFAYEIDRIASAVSKELRHAFSAWIHAVEIPQTSESCVRLDPHALFLSFNYTETLSRLYGVASSQVWHIHGKVPCQPSEIVLGHAWKASDRKPINPSRDPEDDDIREVQGYQRLDDFFDETFKPADRIIRDNAHRFAQLGDVGEVRILGHSLSEVDLPYFEAIAAHVDLARVRWTATYYLEPERDEMNRAMLSLGIPEQSIQLVTLRELQY